MSEIKKYRYLFAALFTILIFTTGILTSNLIDDKRQSALQDTLEDDAADLQSRQLMMNYLDNKDSCEMRKEGLSQIVEGYNDRLERVQSYEENSFFQSGSYENLRRRYVLSGIEYWMFAEETKKECPSYDPNTILFFTEQGCDSCARQGETLSDIKRVYGEDVLVFVIYTDLEDSMIDLLKEEYNVSSPPGVVLNQNTVFDSLASRQNITRNLNLEDE